MPHTPQPMKRPHSCFMEEIFILDSTRCTETRLTPGHGCETDVTSNSSNRSTSWTHCRTISRCVKLSGKWELGFRYSRITYRSRVTSRRDNTCCHLAKTHWTTSRRQLYNLGSDFTTESRDCVTQWWSSVTRFSRSRRREGTWCNTANHCNMWNRKLQCFVTERKPLPFTDPQGTSEATRLVTYV